VLDKTLRPGRSAQAQGCIPQMWVIASLRRRLQRMQPAPGPKAAPLSLSVRKVLARQMLMQAGRLLSARSNLPRLVR
jgi:hypothetical protein